MAYGGNRAYRAGGINTADLRAEREAMRGGGDNYAAAYFANAARNQIDPMELAFKVLGMQEERAQQEQQMAYRERQAQAEEMWRQGQLEQGAAQERRLAGEAERMAGERKAAVERETSQGIQARMDKAEELARQTQKEEMAGKEKEQERKTGLFKKLLEEQAITPTLTIGEGKNAKIVANPAYQRALERLDPGYAAERQAMAAEVEDARRAEAALTPAAPVTKPGMGALGAVMNIPTVGRNVGRYFANIGPNILRALGMDVGTYPYEEMIDPTQFREAQMLMGGEGPNVVGAPLARIPSPQFGNYGPPQEEAPPYMYGVGTRR